MINKGLFSKLHIDDLRQKQKLDDAAQGRMVTLSQAWQNRNSESLTALWDSFIKQALGFLGFAARPNINETGLHGLYDDFDFANCICVVCIVDPLSDIDDNRLGRFWPGKLIAELRKKKLHWGILTNGSRWRLYSTKSAKPYEDYVELDLGATLGNHDQGEYALFENFFHAESFIPELPDDQEQDLLEKEVGVYSCALDLKRKESEDILESKVKAPFLYQIDEIMQYLCNGFIFDTRRPGEAYSEEERREIFESAVKLLYRCLFLFYAESRRLLPAEQTMEDAYGSRSIHTLCAEAHKFQWGRRSDTEGHDMWEHLKGLINAVNDGDPEYGIMVGYNGGLFDDEQEFFLGNHRLRNDFLSRALYLLGYVEPPDSEQKTEYAIPYEDLEVRHLGELYENILEFNITLADEDRVRRRTKNGAEILLLSKTERKKGDTLIKKGDVYFGETALERKQSGSYYTPESLVHFINQKAIVMPLQKKFSDHRERFDSFLEQAFEGRDPATRRGALQAAIALLGRFIRETVLSYKVCDPAMGSGHFLTNASNQLTELVISLLSELPWLEDVQAEINCNPNYWRRLITRHCIYGVDLNPLSTHLAKLSLWLNCFARDHKLTFLDHHLRCGNSLIGVRTFDDVVNAPLKNKERKKKNPDQLSLFSPPELDGSLRMAAELVARIASADEDDTDYQKESFDEAYATATKHIAALADLRTAFLMGDIMTTEEYGELNSQLIRQQGAPAFLDPRLQVIWQQVERLRQDHHFFHWMLEFPDIFAPGAKGGFDATVGNPPWEIVKPNSQEFFSAYLPEFRSFKKQEAIKVSRRLLEGNEAIQEKWDNYSARFVEQSTYFREREAYQFLGKGDINTSKLFLEQFFSLLKSGGHEGIVVPSGLYTDMGCQPLRVMFFDRSAIDCLYCFENRWPTVFNAVDGRFKFVLFCTEKGRQTKEFKCAFMQHDPMKLPAIEAGALKMDVEQVKKFSPDSLSILEFQFQGEISTMAKIYNQWPLVGDFQSNTWNVKLSSEFHSTGDSHLFNENGDGRVLYEGKLIFSFDNQFQRPRYWMNSDIALKEEWRKYWRNLFNVGEKPLVYDQDCYRVGYRRIAASTNERTFLCTVLPEKSVCPDTTMVVRRYTPDAVSGEPIELMNEGDSLLLASQFNSFVLDFVIRRKITTHLDMHFVYSLPLPRCDDEESIFFRKPLLSRTARIICSHLEYSNLWESVFSSDWQSPIFWYPSSGPIDTYGPKHEQDIRKRLRDQATTLKKEWTPQCGVHDRLPDRRDNGDRAQLRAEIDAYVAYLYGLSRDDFSYILDTFPVLKRKEDAAFGEFMSKRKCLEEYDRIEKVLAE